MMGTPVTMKVYRDGDRGMVDIIKRPVAGGIPVTRPRSFYDLVNHKVFSLDLNGNPPVCGAGTFGGDWGDPFEMTAGLMDDVNKQNPKQTGTETLNGFETRVLESTTGKDKIKVWLDTKYGMLVKADAGGTTLIEVKQLTLGPPTAGLLKVPASCAAAPPTENERYANLTGGNAEDFTSAIQPPASPDSCAVLLRVVQAGSMQPVTGFQLAIDTAVDQNHMPSYTTPPTSGGQVRFEGGNMREITNRVHNGTVRLENVPPYFYIMAHFANNAGEAASMIYRHCAGPRTVLLFVLKNASRVGEGGDWLWVKSGKFAAAN